MSSFSMMPPFIVGAANIEDAGTNVALETEWVAGTYTLGDQRRVEERLWEVATTSTSQAPSKPDWFDAGPANRYAAFDVVFGVDQLRPIETKTKNAEEIVLTLTGMSRVNGIAMFGLKATNIKIVATRSTTGDILDIDYDMPNDTEINGSVWNLFFLPKSLATEYVNFGINIPPLSSVEITISNPGGIAEVGVISLGLVSTFGIVTVDSGWQQKENAFTKTEGNLVSVVRVLPSDNITYDVILQNNRANVFKRKMQEVSGVAAVFSAGNNMPEFASYGLAKAQFTAMGNGIHKFKVEVRGI